MGRKKRKEKRKRASPRLKGGSNYLFTKCKESTPRRFPSFFLSSHPRLTTVFRTSYFTLNIFLIDFSLSVTRISYFLGIFDNCQIRSLSKKQLNEIDVFWIYTARTYVYAHKSCSFLSSARRKMEAIRRNAGERNDVENRGPTRKR